MYLHVHEFIRINMYVHVSAWISSAKQNRLEGCVNQYIYIYIYIYISLRKTTNRLH